MPPRRSPPSAVEPRRRAALYRYDPRSRRFASWPRRTIRTTPSGRGSMSPIRRGRTCRRPRRWRASFSTTCTTSASGVDIVTNDFNSQVQPHAERRARSVSARLVGRRQWLPDNFLYVLFDPENAQARLGSSMAIAFFQNAELHGLLQLGAGDDRSRRVDREQYLQTRARPHRARGAVGAAVGARRGGGGGALVAVRVVVHPSSSIYFHKVSREVTRPAPPGSRSLRGGAPPIAVRAKQEGCSVALRLRHCSASC